MVGKLEHKNTINKVQHAVCIAYPSQGHITPMLHLSKLLHSKGFHITFFNSLHNHSCVLQSQGPTALDGGPTFRFMTFSDGLPPSESGLPRPNLPLMHSLECNGDDIFEEVLRKVTDDTSSGRPPVNVIICDPILPFNLDAAKEFVDCPVVLFTPSTPSSFLAHSQSDTLLRKGILPFKDTGFMTDGALDVKLDLEPASMEGMRLRDLPSQVRTTDKNNHVFEYMKHVMARCHERPIIFNTFNALDHEVLKDLSKDVLHGPVYTIGPLHALSNNLTTQPEIDIGSNIWKEDLHCLEWLDSQNPNSVIYASFGSTTTMSNEQLIEFAWGLANSKHPFLWVIRPDIVIGQSAILPVEFENEVKGRGLILSWCPQEKILSHPSIAVFLTHCGWNSMLESISNGVPVICWPYQGDNQPISWWSCYKWGIGLELDIFVKRNQVEGLIRDVLEDEKGKKLKSKAMELRKLIEEATSENGSSSLDLDRLIDYLTSLDHANNGSVV